MSWALIMHRPKAQPLPRLRSTAEILSDIDHQVGRLAVARERAQALIKKIEEGEGDPEDSS